MCCNTAVVKVKIKVEVVRSNKCGASDSVQCAGVKVFDESIFKSIYENLIMRFSFTRIH